MISLASLAGLLPLETNIPGPTPDDFGRGVLADLASPGTPVTVKGDNL